MAEFDGEIKSLFEEQELSESGEYNIKLFRTGKAGKLNKWVTYKIDDRLCLGENHGYVTMNNLSMRP